MCAKGLGSLVAVMLDLTRTKKSTIGKRNKIFRSSKQAFPNSFLLSLSPLFSEGPHLKGEKNTKREARRYNKGPEILRVPERGWTLLSVHVVVAVPSSCFLGKGIGFQP